MSRISSIIASELLAFVISETRDRDKEANLVVKPLTNQIPYLVDSLNVLREVHCKEIRVQDSVQPTAA